MRDPEKSRNNLNMGIKRNPLGDEAFTPAVEKKNNPGDQQV
jgi:hypothetical protein